MLIQTLDRLISTHGDNPDAIAKGLIDPLSYWRRLGTISREEYLDMATRRVCLFNTREGVYLDHVCDFARREIRAVGYWGPGTFTSGANRHWFFIGHEYAKPFRMGIDDVD